MEFRARLLATLRAVRTVLEVPGVMVVGSEVPNLLEPGAASSLVVSQDVDLAIPVEVHAEVKERLWKVEGLRPASEEPSVWVPDSSALLEVNFLGLDRKTRDSGDTYVLEDAELPLLVFGLMSLLEPGPQLQVEGQSIPLPRPATLLAEKLATERSGEKGDRDLLVALGLILLLAPEDRKELTTIYRRLEPELRHTVLANLATLALLETRSGMPDPTGHRRQVAELRRELEQEETP